jgi:chromosome segregation ATPase
MAAAANPHLQPHRQPTEQEVIAYLFELSHWAPKIQAQLDRLERWGNRRTGDLEDRIEELEEDNERLKKEVGRLKNKLREERRERKSATDALWGRPSAAPAEAAEAADL